MSERVLRGLAASPGVAAGPVVLLERPVDDDQPHRGAAAEATAALAALDAVAVELAVRAERLRADGFAAEAEILDANRLMALDPLLRGEVERLTESETAPAALRGAADRQAEVLAGLADPLLAARASDVRELGRRAARGGARRLGAGIVVAEDLGPADVAELREAEQPIHGIALAGGAATSHAAIMARSLGLPMVVGAGEELLRARDDESLVVDGDAGVAYLEPSGERAEWARTRIDELARERRRHARERALPPVTRDGRWVTLLANASTTVEVRAALEAEAEGVGLLRTELAFLEARAWPTQAEHEAALAPLLELLQGAVATVRVLDFGEDKTPPFLAGTTERGIALLLDNPGALAAQLRAIVAVAGTANLRIMCPLVESPQQLRAVRALLRETGAAPPLGAMIETPAGVARAHEIALEADFLSIGTNDLVQYTLGLDRTRPLATARSAGEPAVLRLIADTIAAGHAAGLTVEICGESASVPELAALYVGLGVDELSVAPARIDELRTVVRSSGELGHEQRQVLDGRGGILA